MPEYDANAFHTTDKGLEEIDYLDARARDEAAARTIGNLSKWHDAMTPAEAAKTACLRAEALERLLAAVVRELGELQEFTAAVLADPAAEQQLLRMAQVQERVANISRTTLWRWVREGKFPEPVKLGPQIVAWRASDVRQWLADQE